MIEKSQPSENSVRTQRLWLHIGLRLHNRRIQMGFTEAAVAAHLGIPLERYQAFEAGRAETPATLLDQLADLFKVSIFNFFQGVRFGEIEPHPPSLPELAPVFTVATDEDRLAALVSDFRKLNRERQQYLLLLARVLVEDTGCE
jgi:transcriptional regulator with XRE-family HTH domain